MPAADPSNESPASSPQWFEDAFQDVYRLVYAERTVTQAAQEVECIVRELGISPRHRVLDLCCGHGRHLRAFERLQIPATGVDLSLSLLRKAGQVDGASAARARLVRADMRALPFGSSFDVVVNFFTSFGYFESEADHAAAAIELASVLRPGGQFSMDLMNPPAVIASLNPRTKRRVESFEVVENRRYDAGKRRIEKRVELRDRIGGARRDYRESVRLFSREEITELLEQAGLRVERVLGDFSGRLHTSESPRMILLGRKAAR